MIDRAKLDKFGAVLVPGVLDSGQIAQLAALVGDCGTAAGHRLCGKPALAAWLADTDISAISRAVLGPNAEPVRAILFDKTPTRNWSLGWHQDRTIAVRARADVPGFSNWNVKRGIAHCEPPFDVLERMLTLRIHLDPVGNSSGPLRIAPGSHNLGRISEGEIEAVIAAAGERLCLAEPGDVWVYRTPILHASDRSRASVRRRVLQIDYTSQALPAPLEWQGIA